MDKEKLKEDQKIINWLLDLDLSIDQSMKILALLRKDFDLATSYELMSKNIAQTPSL